MIGRTADRYPRNVRAQPQHAGALRPWTTSQALISAHMAMVAPACAIIYAHTHTESGQFAKSGQIATRVHVCQHTSSGGDGDGCVVSCAAVSCTSPHKNTHSSHLGTHTHTKSGRTHARTQNEAKTHTYSGHLGCGGRLRNRLRDNKQRHAHTHTHTHTHTHKHTTNTHTHTHTHTHAHARTLAHIQCTSGADGGCASLPNRHTDSHTQTHIQGTSGTDRGCDLCSADGDSGVTSCMLVSCAMPVPCATPAH